MLQLVSNFINLIKTGTDADRKRNSGENIFTISGRMIYQVDRRGYFGIQDYDGNAFLPFNSRDFPKMLKDRMPVRCTLEYYPDLGNFYGWGKPVRIIRIEAVRD